MERFFLLAMFVVFMEQSPGCRYIKIYEHLEIFKIYDLRTVHKYQNLFTMFPVIGL